MPLFAALFKIVGGGIALLLAKLFAARLAIRAAGVAALITIVGVLMAVFNGVVAPLAALIFSTSYGWVLGLAFPPIAGTCVAAMAAVWAACGLYSLNRRSIQMAAGS